MIDVLVVDDHAVVRRGLELLLATCEDIRLVGEAVDGRDAIDKVAALAPQLVLMDLSMPQMGGVEATRVIHGDHPEVAVVVLTSFSDAEQVMAALDAGAVGYVMKDSAPEELLAAIRSAAGGGSPLDPRAARVLLTNRKQGGAAPATSSAALTDREREVLALVVEGLANKQIGRRLGISERTVKAHLTSAFQRIGVHDRTQAALWARDHLS